MNSIKPYAGPLDNLEGKIRGDVCVKVLAALRSAELMKAAAGGDIKLKIGNHILNQSSADDLITFFRYLLAVCIADKTPVPEGEGGAQRFENAVKTVGTLARLLANSKNGSQKERELLKKLFDVIPEAKTYKNVSNYIDRANDEKFEKLDIGMRGNVKRVAEQFFLKLNEPKVYVFINEGAWGIGRSINDMLSKIKTSDKNSIMNYVGGSKDRIAAVSRRGTMNFGFAKDAGDGDTPSAIMMIGASGAGKTRVINEILAVKNDAKSPFAGKPLDRVIIAPRIGISIADTGTTLTFGEQMETKLLDDGDVQKTMKEFEKRFTRATPFNINSSRAHHIFRFGDDKNPGLLGDLCGMDSATDISMKAFGVNIFSPEFIGIFNVSKTYRIMRENPRKYKMALEAAKVLKKNDRQLWSTWMTSMLTKTPARYALGPLGKETPDEKNKRDETNNSVSILAMILLCNMQRTRRYAQEAYTTQAYQVFTGEVQASPMLTTLGKKPLLAYTANIIMRCLESMWISRSLDELSMVYDTTLRGEGVHSTSKTGIYHVPPGMDMVGNTYTVKSSDLLNGNANNKNAPYALGVRNRATPLSALARLVEPNLTKSGANSIRSSKVHRLFILLNYDGIKANNPNNNSPQRKTLERLASLVPSRGRAVLKRTRSAKNSSLIMRRAVNRLFTSPKTKFRGLGIASMIGTQFTLNGNRQTFPNPGTSEFQQMINEIGKRDISNLNGGQERLALVRLSALAKIANKNDIIRKIRNGANTTRITPTETANLRKAIRTAIKGEPMKNLFNGINENTTEADRLEDIAIALGPSPGNVAIARVNSAMRRQKNPSV